MDKFDSSTPLNKAFNGSKKTIYSKNLAFRAAKVTIVLKTGAQVLGFLVTILLVKILSEQEYGAYNTFISSISVIGSIFSLGIGNTLQRYIPKYIKNEEFILAKKIVHYAFFARFISLCIICLFGYIYRMEIATWMNISEYIAAVVPFIFVVILHFQSRLLGSILIACLFQGVNQSAQITLVLTKVVLYMYLSINNVDLVAILIADLVAYGFMMIVIILGYVKYIKPLNGGRKNFDQEERKDILKYAAFNNLNDVGLVSLGRDIDVIFLASMVDVISAGAYAFANRISHTLKQISPVSYFIDIIRPLFFTLDATNEKDKINLFLIFF
jgi:O-antigen/teichoic acid export membrane protein